MMVSRASLSKLTPIAKGGFGQVCRVGNFTLPGDGSPLAYKEFTDKVPEQGRSASAAVAFRDGLGSTDRAALDRYAAWPRAGVTAADGTVCGLLMPLIADDFFCELHPAKGPLRKPRDMGWLIASADLRQQNRIDLPDIGLTDRVLLLAQLAYAIGWLHRRGWVYGDLSFRNAVFALDPPRMMLLDCDGAAALADAGRDQPSTPFWEPPESMKGQPGFQRQQDPVTDAYKLGLAILRCLTPGHGAASTKNPRGVQGVLDAQGAGLVTAALSADRAGRPTAKELYGYLRSVAASRVAPPAITVTQAATPVVQQGQEAWVGWQIQGGRQVIVTVGPDVVARLDPHVARTGCAFRPVSPGPVRIEVMNQYGQAVADAGYVTLFKIPEVTVTIPDLAAPAIPALPRPSLGGLPLTLPGLPDVRAAVPAVPAVPVPDIGSLLPGGVPDIRFPLPAASPEGMPAIAWPDFHDEFIQAASAGLAVLLGEAALEVATERTGGQR